MADEPAVEVRDAVVEHRSGVRVGPVSFTVGRGEFVAVAGPNGSGKTTLLNLVAGRLEPRSGRVCAPRRSAIAVLPQRHVFNDLAPVTVRDVVAFGRLPAGRAGECREGRIAEAMAATGVGEIGARLFRELSGGQKQLVQIARLVAQDAGLWLLDEPLAGLDLKWRRVVVRLLDRLHAARRVAVIYVTHQLDCFPASCSRALLLDEGRLLCDGAPGEVLSEASLEALYESVNHAGLD